MTHYAREVLEDCRVAVSKLKDGISGRDWRIAWVTSVALLRAVGHVLQKVDSQTNPRLQQAISTAWQKLAESRPEPAIFWSFIEEERNSILKEYRMTAGQGVTVRPGTAHINLRTGEQWSEPGLPTLYRYEMHSGPYAGRDQRDVLSEAIAWWEMYLDKIDEQTNAGI